ncbi:leucine-rich repeat domain-containing protein [Bacillus timonensis]|nr:leucine-rich repeat domain-containing protein [Bacillus timonensis]
MQKFKFFNVLIALSLAITLLTPFSSASANAPKLKREKPSYVTENVYDVTGDTYDPTCDTYEDPTCDTYGYEPVSLYVDTVRNDSLTISWDYYGEVTENLQFAVSHQEDGVDSTPTTVTVSGDTNTYSFTGLEADTAYVLTVEALMDGVPTGEISSVIYSTHPNPTFFEDAVVEMEVRYQFGIFDRDLVVADLVNLEYLYVPYQGVTSLKGIEHAINLIELVVFNNNISDISMLASLQNLTYLDLENNNVSNIEVLLELPNLEVVYLYGNPLNAEAASVITTLISNGVAVYFEGEEEEFTTGWNEFHGKWYFLDEEGYPVTGWLNDGGTWYYLSETEDDNWASMVTGWNLINGKWYFFNGSGAMKTGWLQSGGKWYFLTSSGHMATGWIKDGGSWYHLSASGAMSTGWVKDGASWYYLTGSGAMKTGWLFSGSKWYHLQASGAMSVGWKKINNKWYYFYSQGHMAANTMIDGYKVGKDGAWIQ